ncbi:uncharacterized protein LOC100201429 isoform X2 [Hydra vulgaris]|uniref:Uncharacterized protein LOC100201429 isoform X2 n=1 Tax=Hydra vulgaris TaxID=6087 RepID=A0ABM4BJS6_HYDVU
MVTEVQLSSDSSDKYLQSICIPINQSEKISKVLKSNECVRLEFIDLTVSVDGKEILSHVSGEINPGEVLAIMGPSGAGKSTLLNLLVGREKKGQIINSGTIKLNGEKASKLLRRKIGYVLQEDIFFSNLTVRQSLEFVGKICLPDFMTWKEKLTTINEAINNLGLKKCENTILGGDPFSSGCSGGERKRCSIAVELIRNPACIIMDEPTSGLDSSTSLSLIKTLKRLAKNENRAVCMTIHQPSSPVFHMFDKLLLLCNGKVLYFGKNSEVLSFFQTIGMPCYPNWNPADFIMDQLTAHIDVQNKIAEGYLSFIKKNPFCNKISLDFGKHEISSSMPVNSPDHCKSHTNFAIEYVKELDTSDSNAHKEHNFANGKGIENSAINVVSTEKWPTSYFTQASALCRRSFLQTKGHFWNKICLMQAFTISAIASLVWFNTPYNEKSLQDRLGFMFYIMVYMFTNQMFTTLLTFPIESKVIAKERDAGMYRLSAYYTAKNVVDLPIIFLPQFFIYTVTYWITGLNRSPIFLLGLFNNLLITLTAQSLGLIIGASIQNLRKAHIVAITVLICSMLSAGFYTKRLPSWLSWFKYISQLTYIYNVFVRLEFQYSVKLFECSPKSIFQQCTSNSTYISGNDIMIKTKNIDLNVTQSFLVIIGIIVILKILFYFVLKYLNKPS